MKKKVRIVVFLMLCCLSGCANEETKNGIETTNQERVSSEIADRSNSDEVIDESEEKTKMNEINRTIIAQVLGVEEDHIKIRYILSCLDTIQAGQIQTAEIVEVNESDENVIHIVAEDGTNYQMGLSRGFGVMYVQNIDTGEYPIQSER